LSAPNQTSTIIEPINDEQQACPKNVKTVSRCDFRLAGRLSNEDARLLTSLHESIAAELAVILDMFLGTEFQVKFKSFREVTVREYLADSLPISYAVPTASGLMIADFNLDIVFPLIELLMGGAGDSDHANRDLSEIEVELMHDIVVQVMRPVEAAWSIPGLTLTPGTRVESSSRFRMLRPAEKVAKLRFEMSVGNSTGWLELVVARPLVEMLMKRIKADQPQKPSKIRSFPAPPLRERMLECEMEVVTELADLKVAVKDLVTLRPGSVLKLRAPVRTPGMLTAGGRGLFEATPVRNGQQRAAQLGRRAQQAEWKRV
jgi:flagellar motor switch protein FliM